MSESENVAPGLDEDAKPQEEIQVDLSPEVSEVKKEAKAGDVSQATEVTSEVDTEVPQEVTTEDEERPSDKVTDPGFHKTFGTVETIMDALKDVVDPELSVNVVDLGLVYGVDIDDQGHATVDMTLTSPMCPLTDRLEADVHYLLSEITSSVTLNWVWLPPWSLDMISEDGREQLRAIGFNL